MAVLKQPVRNTVKACQKHAVVLLAPRSSLGLLTHFFLCLKAVGDVTANVGQDQFEFTDMHLWESSHRDSLIVGHICHMKNKHTLKCMLSLKIVLSIKGTKH